MEDEATHTLATDEEVTAAQPDVKVGSLIAASKSPKIPRYKRRQCESNRKDGDPCTAPATPKSRFCVGHLPRNPRNRGQRKVTKVASVPPEYRLTKAVVAAVESAARETFIQPDPDLAFIPEVIETTADVERLILGSLREQRSGRIDAKTLTAYVFAASVLLKSHDAGRKFGGAPIDGPARFEVTFGSKGDRDTAQKRTKKVTVPVKPSDQGGAQDRREVG